jgi:hypothetical protein
VVLMVSLAQSNGLGGMSCHGPTHPVNYDIRAGQ